MTTTVKTVRVPDDLAARVEEESANVGLMVKRVLNARVEGRSAPRDPRVDLVTTFSYLAPAGPEEEG